MYLDEANKQKLAGALSPKPKKGTALRRWCTPWLIFEMIER
jgi:hypothetical protein